MTTANDQSQGIYVYFFKHILRVNDYERISKVLEYECMIDVYDLWREKSDELKDLHYVNESGERVYIPTSAATLIDLLRNFLRYNVAPHTKDLMSFTYEDFDEYCIDHGYVLLDDFADILTKESDPSTLSESEVLFHHIFKNVLKQADDSNIMKALEHADITDVFELIDLTFKEISSFQYFDEYGQCTTLHSSEYMLLAILRRFLEFNAEKYSDDYLAITYDDFDDFFIEFGFDLSYLLNPMDNLPSSSAPVAQDVIGEDDLDFTAVEEDVTYDEDQV